MDILLELQIYEVMYDFANNIHKRLKDTNWQVIYITNKFTNKLSIYKLKFICE